MEDEELLWFLVGRFYGVLDTDGRANGNGVVNFTEIASGLLVLSGGTSETKMRAAFALYDNNGDRFTTQDKMVQYL